MCVCVCVSTKIDRYIYACIYTHIYNIFSLTFLLVFLFSICDVIYSDLLQPISMYVNFVSNMPTKVDRQVSLS